MRKPESHRPSKRRAIQKALSQLGWHARSKEVIALLADYGIEVSSGLVNGVKVESLKKVDQSKMKQAMTNQMARQRRTKSNIKLPQRRTYWR